MTQPNRQRWSFVMAMRGGVADLFPTPKAKLAMWGVVCLGVLITFAELLAALLFSELIIKLNAHTTETSALLLIGFLVAFGATRAVSYFQSVYRLTIFERAFRRVTTGSAAAEAWRWPMAISLVGILGQIARLLTVSFTVVVLSRVFGVLLLGCTVVAGFIVDRAGRHQYLVHHEFIEAKRAGRPPTPAERIGTRIRAGERAGLVAVIPVTVFVASLGIGALRGSVTPDVALVLFISARMSANMYGSLATSTMRFIRDQVNVEVYGEASSVQAKGPGPRNVGTSEVAIDEADVLTIGRYAEPPIQAFARLVDEGRYLGDLDQIRQLVNAAGGMPDEQLRRHAAPARPDRLVVTGPNQVWWLESFRLPIRHGHPAQLSVVVDAFSQKIIWWLIGTVDEYLSIDAAAERAAEVEGVVPESVRVVSQGAPSSQLPHLHDLLRKIQVKRLLLWVSSQLSVDEIITARPSYPLSFPTVSAAESWALNFVRWYNYDFYHPAIGYLPPVVAHDGLAATMTDRRRAIIGEQLSRVQTDMSDPLPVLLVPPVEAVINMMSVSTLSGPTTNDTYDDALLNEESP